MWLELVAARAVKYPDDAIPTYRQLIEKMVEKTSNTAYDDAIKLLIKLKPLHVRLGTSSDFTQYIAHLRAKYKAKRNFIKLLDKL